MSVSRVEDGVEANHYILAPREFQQTSNKGLPRSGSRYLLHPVTSQVQTNDDVPVMEKSKPRRCATSRRKSIH